jgi:hypothetical protein
MKMLSQESAYLDFKITEARLKRGPIHFEQAKIKKKMSPRVRMGKFPQKIVFLRLFCSY